MKNSPDFMKPEGSLPCSQEPATSPHPQPHQYIPRQHRISSTVILRLFSHLRLHLQSCLSFSYFAHQNPLCIPPVPHSCLVHLTSTSKLHLGHGELILLRSQSINHDHPFQRHDLLRARNVSCSNSGSENGYPDSDFLQFFSPFRQILR